MKSATDYASLKTIAAHDLAGPILPNAQYSLAIPADQRRHLAIGWLLLSMASLGIAGLFSLLLVLSRTPYLQHIFPLVDFFHVALVVHVDLSVLVWFLAFAGLFWSVNSTPYGLGFGWLALIVFALGTLLMSAAPFFGQGGPIMSNYIPVLQDPLFLTGLVTLAAGSGLLVLRSMLAAPRVGTGLDGSGALRFGLNTAAVSAAVALIAFAWSWLTMPAGLEGKAYYELLFWGGGHVIQFTYTLLMLVAWLWLASASGARIPLTPRVAVLMFGVGLAAVFAVPLIYLAHEVSSVGHRKLLTWLMQFGGGLAIVPLAMAVLLGLLRRTATPAAARPFKAALISSMILFGAGGGIGFLIHGSSVTIPAHYHGCIVGVTLAFMGVSYLLLPELGFQPPANRPASLQPYLYGSGQLMHIIGLVWSGGYGVQRKVAGSEQVLHSLQETAGMGLMGLGGLIAVIGGLLFLVLIMQSIWRTLRRQNRHAGY